MYAFFWFGIKPEGWRESDSSFVPISKGTHYCASGVWYKEKISKILKQNLNYSVCKISVFKEAPILYVLQLCSFSNHKSYMHQHKPNFCYT